MLRATRFCCILVFCCISCRFCYIFVFCCICSEYDYISCRFVACLYFVALVVCIFLVGFVARLYFGEPVLKIVAFLEYFVACLYIVALVSYYSCIFCKLRCIFIFCCTCREYGCISCKFCCMFVFSCWPINIQHELFK